MGPRDPRRRMEACRASTGIQWTIRVQQGGLGAKGRHLTRRCCGNGCTTSPPVHAAWCSRLAPRHRGRVRSPAGTSSACGRPGGASAVQGGHAARARKKHRRRRGLLSKGCPVWRVAACLCVPLGSPPTRPFARWWPRSPKRERRLNPRLRPMTWRCCLIASRRAGGAVRRCCLRRCAAALAAPPAIPLRLLSSRSWAGGLTAPRCGSVWGTWNAWRPPRGCGPPCSRSTRAPGPPAMVPGAPLGAGGPCTRGSAPGWDASGRARQP